MWRRGCRRSNVWLAEVTEAAPLPALTRLIRVQELPGVEEPFDRLVNHLRTAPMAAAAIDAPFSLPRAYLPPGRRPRLLARIAALETAGRPFPRGRELLNLLGLRSPLEPPKPLRATEQVWRSERINVRSTLWDGPRGGAPFTAACLKLLAVARLPSWPWDAGGERLLIEGFPAAQLKSWGWRHAGYDGPDRAARDDIWRGLTARITVADKLGDKATSCADALDAVVLALTARAVTQKQVPLPTVDPGDEGWIAVQRR